MEVITINTDLVVFDAQVFDKKTKRAIGGLTKDDFVVTEKGVRQPVSYLSRDELPLSIMLLIDVSGSVRPILHQIRDGALNALQRLKPDDQVAVMAFADSSRLAQDFTRDRGLVARKIEEATATDALGSGTLLGPALESAAIICTTPDSDQPTRDYRRYRQRRTYLPASGAGKLVALDDSGAVVYGLRVCRGTGSLFPYLGIRAIRGVNEFVEKPAVRSDTNNNDVAEKLALVIDLRARALRNRIQTY